MSFQMASLSGSPTGPAGYSSGQNAAGMKSKIPKGYKEGALQQFTPEQMELFQSLFGHLGPDSFLSKLAGGDQSMFEQMEAPAMRQFDQMSSQLASRFSGAGMGARRGSGFQNASQSQAGQFAEKLQSDRLGIQRQALQDLMGMSGSLLGQRPQEKFLTKKDPGFWGNLGSSLGENLGAVPSAFFKSQGWI